MSTGLYEAHEVITHRTGGHGGLIEVAAMVARGECVAVLLLIDARDPHHDDIQNQILKRVANKREIRLVITYADAARWASFEASIQQATSNSARRFDWSPSGWEAGYKNDLGPLPVTQRTLALTANDGSKASMIEFVDRNVSALMTHHRILATGTTGWLLKLLYADTVLEGTLLTRLPNWSFEYLRKAIEAVLMHLERRRPVSSADSAVVHAPAIFGMLEGLDSIRDGLGITRNPEFASKILALPAGAEGGDVLIANEIIENACDTVVSFHEPAESRPFGGGGRMLELTCQLPGANTGCLDNARSANSWAQGLLTEIRIGSARLDRYSALRNRFKLSEIVGVDFEDDPFSDIELGRALNRAGAGYLHAAVTRLIAQGGGRVVVSWGWTMRGIVDELRTMHANCEIEQRSSEGSRLVWSPAVGVLPSLPELGAEAIASDLREFYGGKLEGFTRAGFMREGGLPGWDDSLKHRIRNADLVLISASPWHHESGLYQMSGVNPDLFPDIADREVVEQLEASSLDMTVPKPPRRVCLLAWTTPDLSERQEKRRSSWFAAEQAAAR